MEFTNTPLYGGAITVDLPSSFADASQIRQVPDHQEVYLASEGYTSIVVEILEYVDKPSDAEALQYHFSDLVDGTGDSTNLLRQESAVMKKVAGKPVHVLSFIQTPGPNENPRRKVPEFVYIHLLLLRLKEKGTDLMVTVNVPHYKGEYEAVKEGEKTALMKDGDEAAEKVLETFDIKEWGLFDG